MDYKTQMVKVATLKTKLEDLNGITFEQTKVDYKGEKYNAWKFFKNGKPLFTMCGAGRDGFMPLIEYTEHGQETNTELSESVAMDFWDFLGRLPKKLEKKTQLQVGQTMDKR